MGPLIPGNGRRLAPVAGPGLLSHTVRKPGIEKVGMKAKASATPPNWASTPHNEVMNRLSRPSGRAVDTAYARTCLLYTSPSPRDRTRSRMPSSA